MIRTLKFWPKNIDYNSVHYLENFSCIAFIQNQGSRENVVKRRNSLDRSSAVFIY